MRSRWPILLAPFLVAQALFAGPGDPPAEEWQERVRQAALATYIHGMTDEIAMREVGPEGVPALLQLLADPEFPRRDNVVALLAHLAGDDATPALLDQLEQPVAPPATAAEDRALLLVPQALGHISRRGGLAATQALLTLTSPAGDRGPLDHAVDRGSYSIERAEELAQQARYGMRISGQDEGHNQGPAAQESHSGLLVLAERPGTSLAAAPRAVDSNSIGHLSELTYANHVSVPDPMTDSTLDAGLGWASELAGRSDFDADVGCCIRIARGGSARSFGSAGDGLDVVDSESKLLAVADNPTARVKIVRLINWCGTSGTNIVGCAYQPGPGMVVVRLGSNEGVLWLHEYGHNTGIDHNSDERYIMHGRLSSGSRALTSAECSTYHYPSPYAYMATEQIGVCHDNDGDDYSSTSDNCPDLANPDQADEDSDGLGDVCDGCVDQDADGYGLSGHPECPQGLSADCDDLDAAVFPGARELCDGQDNDCDGSQDEALCDEFEATGDGRIDGVEVVWLGWSFGLCDAPGTQWWSPIDYTEDGCVDGDDLAILATTYGCIGDEPVCE